MYSILLNLSFGPVGTQIEIIKSLRSSFYFYYKNNNYTGF